VPTAGNVNHRRRARVYRLIGWLNGDPRVVNNQGGGCAGGSAIAVADDHRVRCGIRSEKIADGKRSRSRARDVSTVAQGRAILLPSVTQRRTPESGDSEGRVCSPHCGFDWRERSKWLDRL